jgi:single-stranded-DNA-specific exonuclease
MQWKQTETDRPAAEKIAAALGISSVCADMLVQRGLCSPEAAEDFLRPRLSHLDDPFALTGLKAAVDRIEEAIEARAPVVIFGDYDVDGITSTVQLVSMLRRFGLEPRYCVPRRMEEGYGLSRRAIDRVFDGEPPELFIALDCGTNACEPIAYLRELGVDVIVVDHHQAKAALPEGVTLINPHVLDAPTAPWRHLCTAGLVFKLLHGLLKSRRAAGDPRVESIQLKDFLDLVALGTVADLVPLHHENRILSWYGLQHLRANGRAGIRALAEISGVDSGQEMSSSDISFKLGPRLNACGRIADAALPIKLLLGKEDQGCREMARELDAYNKERQTIERKITRAAEVQAQRDFADMPGVVLFGGDWHPGVVGIVASRVSRRLHKPCVVLGAEGALAKGSGRSVSDVNLVELFQCCDHLLDNWGGHPMAAGVALPRKNVEAFTECFCSSLQRLYPEGLPEPSLKLDAWLEADELDEALLSELERLHPFGQGNYEPVFGLRGVRLAEPTIPFAGSNQRFRLPQSNGRKLSGIAWQLPDPLPVGAPLDMAVRFAWNCWRGRRTPQLTLVDWKPAEG